MPHWRGAIAGGIWQSVRLVASGPVVVDDVFVIPRLEDDTARVQLRLDNTNTKSGVQDVALSVLHEGQVVAEHGQTIRLKPGKNLAQWVLKIPGAQLWSPDEPNLYTLTVKIAGSDRR